MFGPCYSRVSMSAASFSTRTPRARKGRELAANPKAGTSLLLEIPEPADPHPRPGRARDRGGGGRLLSRRGPKGAQIGAWASQQSRPLESRLAFEKAIAVYGAKYAIGAVPRPPHWSGYRIVPISIEFWHDRPFRLHDRVEFRRAGASEPWTKVRMYP